MTDEIHARFASHLPEGDVHPYRTGAWRPNTVEHTARDLPVVGAIPPDLHGVYLRNTENPLFDAITGRYHPFDGDGMLHAVRFAGGAVSYRNRFVRTDGLRAEVEAGRALWAGILEDPALSERPGCGARTGMKDASSTDVIVHDGVALTTFYQCGDAWAQDPVTLEPLGRATWGGAFPTDWGISAHPKVDPRTGELLYFSYGKQAPYLRFGVVRPGGRVRLQVDVPLPGPRLPHDMAFTDRFAILNDFPLFWDPALLDRGVHFARYFDQLPSRFALVDRRTGDVRWFEAPPTYALHFANAYDDGDTVVLDGYPQADPAPARRPDDGPFSMLMRYIALDALGARLHRWRFDLRSGACTVEPLDDAVAEFPVIHPHHAGRPYRYVYAATNRPGWFLFDGFRKTDLRTGASTRLALPDGVTASEPGIAPRPGATDEDDAWLVTIVSDVPNDRSECWIVDCRDLAAGPVARIGLPERICSGTHATWWDGPR